MPYELTADFEHGQSLSGDRSDTNPTHLRIDMALTPIVPALCLRVRCDRHEVHRFSPRNVVAPPVMASLVQDPKTGRYLIRFRHSGKAYKRSLRTTTKRHAQALMHRIEETQLLIERGHLAVPVGIDPGDFIVSDGRLKKSPKPSIVLTLKSLFDTYRTHLPAGAKAPSTLQGEAIHIGHLLRLLGPSRSVQALQSRDVQDYIASRLKELWNDRPIRPCTVKKEITTLRLIWNWAVDQGYLTGRPPTKSIIFPKDEEKPPFMTRCEIERTIRRGGLTEDEEKELWASLFLTSPEIQELLAHVQAVARQPFVYPMFLFACHTGARRSEILRSRIDDFDLHTQSVRIREKKKNKSKAMTFRYVPLTDQLAQTMEHWFASHPGGQYTITQPLQTFRGKKRLTFEPLTPSEARDHFKRPLRKSKWNKVKGFHVFRHSFASNLAAASVDQRIIDEWMGHQTEEMRRRYRHLFPEQQRQAIQAVFGT